MLSRFYKLLGNPKIPVSVPPSSSLGKSITSDMPYNAPPVFPQTNYIAGSPSIARHVTETAATARTMAPIVSSKFRAKGIRFLYSVGGQVHSWFQMMATGQVESSRFQRRSAYTWSGTFNDALYQAGYPGINLGWSEKVPSIPPAALGTAPWQMLPTPRITRNVFTTRSYRTAPSVPAKPMNG